MIGLKCIGVLAGLVATAVASGALADNLSYIGSASTSPSGSQQQGVTQAPASYAVSGDYGSASASMNLDVPGGLLSSAASATTTGNSSGFSQLDYSFQIHSINGPAPYGAGVLLGVTATGYADSSGSGGSSDVQFFLTEQEGVAIDDYVGSSRYAPGGQTYTYSHGPITVGLDDDISVRLVAASNARGGLQYCTIDCDASAVSWIDPVFTILGPNASNYRIVGVPGPSLFTSAAPEPGAWILMIVGLGLAGATLRRRRPSTFA